MTICSDIIAGDKESVGVCKWQTIMNLEQGQSVNTIRPLHIYKIQF